MEVTVPGAIAFKSQAIPTGMRLTSCRIVPRVSTRRGTCKNVTRAMDFETTRALPASASKRLSIRVLVVDDHALIRDGLTFLIAGQPDMEVVAEAADDVRVSSIPLSICRTSTLMDLRMADMGGHRSDCGH